MTESSEARLAKNESLFRQVNENIASVAGTLGGDTPYEFVCECATADCLERILMTRREYERVRSEGTHFLMIPRHADPALERVVATYGTYVVVEKDGAAGLVAQANDPRS